MNTVLLPTDFSSNAEKALEFAVEVSLHLNAELVIFHTFHSFYTGATVSPVPESKMREEDLEKLYAVRDVALQIAGGREISITLESRSGLAADEIVSYADELQADLVVMGTKGATGLEEALLGSVSSNVIAKTNVPVLIVPADAAYKGFDHIAYALDLGSENRLIVSQLLRFASVFNARITAVHVYDKNEVVKIPTLDELRKSQPELFHYDHVDFQAEIYDDILEGLEAYCDREHPSCIAVLARRRGFFEGIFHTSISKKLACHSHIPVLAYHE